MGMGMELELELELEMGIGTGTGGLVRVKKRVLPNELCLPQRNETGLLGNIGQI